MKTTYATMHKTICLDKAVNEDGNPAPVTFDLRKVVNGQMAWQGQRIRRDYATMKEAMKELHAVFLLEMEEHGYEFRVQGEPYYMPLNDGTDNFGYLPYAGESGWYDLNNNYTDKASYPTSEYPGTESEWMDHKITGYAYDNYRVCIVTSDGDVVY